MKRKNQLIIIGGGLAGSEAAWQAAQRGIYVRLYEMRPKASTGAHTTDQLAELVCSNSLGSNLNSRASGLLKAELRRLSSLLISIADKTALPAGGAVAVDRQAFSSQVTEALTNHKMVELIRDEVREIPNPMTVIASGPLTSPSFSEALQRLTGYEHLFFYDAIAPIVSLESIDMNIAYRASRYGRGEKEEGDYINCPLTEEEYDNFINQLISAERIKLSSFESDIAKGVKAGAHFFEGCLPIEILAQRGRESLAFGPMRPVGLRNPHTGNRPYAVVQLRQDNLAGTLYNMVGFQTNLTYAEQKHVFQTIPGLGNAEFIRFGQMHRNTFINSPKLLRPTLQYKDRETLLFSGQITGVEGYVGNIATGLLAGWNAARLLLGLNSIQLPTTTMLGALCHYITHADEKVFQPMKANFGILPPLDNQQFPTKLGKLQKGSAYAERSLNELENFLSTIQDEQQIM